VGVVETNVRKTRGFCRPVSRNSAPALLAKGSQNRGRGSAQRSANGRVRHKPCFHRSDQRLWLDATHALPCLGCPAAEALRRIAELYAIARGGGGRLVHIVELAPHMPSRHGGSPPLLRCAPIKSLRCPRLALRSPECLALASARAPFVRHLFLLTFAKEGK
jgi:hypothetical protein